MQAKQKTGHGAVERNAYRVAEVAESMSIGRSTLYKLIAEGRGPQTTKLGSATLVMREDFESWRDQVRNAQGPRIG